MEFKVGEKVWVDTPSWCEECTVIKRGYSSQIIFVCRANGTSPAIYKSWASKVIPKNRQLLFDFMEGIRNEV